MPDIIVSVPKDWEPGICVKKIYYICPFSKKGCWARKIQDCPMYKAPVGDRKVG